MKSSFSMWQKIIFWTQQLARYILYTPLLFLNQFSLVNYFDIHKDVAFENSTKCYPNSKKKKKYFTLANKIKGSSLLV